MSVNAAGEPVYYTAPIELWQDFLENSNKVLVDVLEYCACQYDSLEEAQSKLFFSGGNWDNMKENVKSIGKDFCGVKFSISRKLYWDYRNCKKSEDDKLLLLAYLAINSMRGAFSFTNSTFLFCRMSGFGRMEDFKEKWRKNKAGGYKHIYNNGSPRMAHYLKSTRTMGRKCASLRLDLMRKFDNIHFYSEQGKRDFAFMFDEKRDRQTCLDELAQKMHHRGKNAQRDDLKEMMRRAKCSIENK